MPVGPATLPDTVVNAYGELRGSWQKQKLQLISVKISHLGKLPKSPRSVI